MVAGASRVGPPAMTINEFGGAIVIEPVIVVSTAESTIVLDCCYRSGIADTAIVAA
jgi:hypothetical protein